MRHFIRRLLGRLRRRGTNRTTEIDTGGSIRPTGRLEAMKISKRKEMTDEREGIGEHVTAIVRTDEEITAIRVADSEGQSVSANVAHDGTVDFSIRGKSRQGEVGVVQVCRILVDCLNQGGARWEGLEAVGDEGGRAEQGIDCEARDSERILKIQVVRAEADAGVWRALAREGQTSGRLSLEQVADSLRRAIEKKATRTPPRDRLTLTLALDATETASHAFERVRDHFLTRHGVWARELGFAGIWLVGPNIALTSQLDRDDGEEMGGS